MPFSSGELPELLKIFRKGSHVFQRIEQIMRIRIIPIAAYIIPFEPEEFEHFFVADRDCGSWGLLRYILNIPRNYFRDSNVSETISIGRIL